jgi:serine/threonine protein phosphatase PrpC
MGDNRVSISARTDVGQVRDHNEDNFIVCADVSAEKWYLDEKPFRLSPAGCLMVVADGMGGANAGEVASHIAVEQVKYFFSNQEPQALLTGNQETALLGQAILMAHRSIVAYAATHPACLGMGTTILVAWIKPWQAFVGWCGDSRGYLYRPKEGIKIITRDHSLVWEMVEAGQISPQEADVHPNSNIITQSLGDPKSPPQPDFMALPLQPLDRLLLCSDGLNNMVGLEEIEQIFFQDKPLPEINQKLIEAANRNGGKDNITVVSLEVLEKASPVQETAAPGKSYKNIVGVILPVITALAFLLFWNPFKQLLNTDPNGPSGNTAGKSGTVTVKDAGLVPEKTGPPGTGAEKVMEQTKAPDGAMAGLPQPEGGPATGLKKTGMKKAQPPKIKSPPPKKEVPNTLDPLLETALLDKIMRIKKIVEDKNTIGQQKDQEPKKLREEDKFYEEEVKKARMEMSTLIENLDSIINTNSWPDLIADYEATNTTEASRRQLLLKWQDVPDQGSAIGEAEKIIDQLHQVQLKLKQ